MEWRDLSMDVFHMKHSIFLCINVNQMEHTLDIILVDTWTVEQHLDMAVEEYLKIHVMSSSPSYYSPYNKQK